MLDFESRVTLMKREHIGRHCIETANGRGRFANLTRDDVETAAKDAISDILTAVFGPAGKTVQCSDGDGWIVEYDWPTQDKAREFVQSALDSYFGDVEDYTEDVR